MTHKPKEPKLLSIENEVILIKITKTKTIKTIQINNNTTKITSTSKPSNPISSEKVINLINKTLSETQNPIKK